MSSLPSERLDHRIPPAGLAHVADAGIAGLGSTEATVLRERLALERCRVALARARADLARVTARRRATRADVKVATAERSAALAHADASAGERAAQAIAAAKDATTVLRLLIQWKRAAVVAAKARVGSTTAAVRKAAAELELKRARLVITRDHGARQPYVDQLEALAKVHRKAHRHATSRVAEAERLRLVWEAAAADHGLPI